MVPVDVQIAGHTIPLVKAGNQRRLTAPEELFSDARVGHLKSPGTYQLGSLLEDHRVVVGAQVLVHQYVSRHQDLLPVACNQFRKLAQIEAGKPVVTGNKAALAEHWSEFVPFMRRGLLFFEASVMAGTPAIAPLVSVLRGSEPLRLEAVLNGTCSYIIGRLEDGLDFASALREAQESGYAEADPTLDIGGIDAAHKLSIMARLAFDPDLDWQQVLSATSGISELTPNMVKEAMEDGGRVALLASITPGDTSWQASVRPVYLPAGHSLADLSAGLNGIVFEGRQSGKIFISGPGAGGDATASAVLADLLEAAAGRPGPAPLERARPLPADRSGQLHGELRQA